VGSLIKHFETRAGRYQGFASRISNRLTMCALLIISFGIVIPARTFASGVDPANLGKGDWIWEMAKVESRLNVSNTQAVIDYEAGLGVQWIAVKCGDGTNGLPNSWTQFSPALIAQAHAAGLKIFGWAYAYGYDGNEVTGEINAATRALQLGADGIIMDVESEFETSPDNAALAAQYCQGIRAVFPNTFLACACPPYLSQHPLFPYVTFGSYADAWMPQTYWNQFQITPAKMAADLDREWTAWQNALTGANRNAIKPIVPVAETDATNQTGADIIAFASALANDPTPATLGGYHGLSFWDCQERNTDMDNGVKSAAVNFSAQVTSSQIQGFATLTGGSVQFDLNGQTGSAYAIEYSTNLASWSPMVTITNTTGSYHFTDSTSASRPTTFYRARLITP
jgi:hypothetical protein